MAFVNDHCHFPDIELNRLSLQKLRQTVESMLLVPLSQGSKDMVTIATSESPWLCKMQKYNLQYFGLWRCFYCLSWHFGSHSLSRDLWQPQALSLLLVFLPASQKSEEHLCRHPSSCCSESKVLVQAPMPNYQWVCYSIWTRSATPRMREYLNLQSFSECPQHPSPTFLVIIWWVTKFFKKLSAWFFNCVSICYLSYLEES